MSDLAATNCQSSCSNGCDCGSGSNCFWIILLLLLCNNNGCDNNCGCSCGCDIIWIILLLFCCCNGNGNNGFGFGCC